MDDGAMLDMTTQPDYEDLDKKILKTFLGMMIPRAWKLAPDITDGDNDAYSNPFFVNGNVPCGERPDDFDYATDDKDFTEICYKDEAWFLMVVHAYREKDDIDFTNMHWRYGLTAPPGDTKLLNEGGYYGVTAEDLLASAQGGYEKGGEQYWEMPEDEGYVTGDGPNPNDYGLQFTQGIREPGLVQVLVCQNFQDTVDTMDDVVHSSKEEEGSSPTFDHTFPCG